MKLRAFALLLVAAASLLPLLGFAALARSRAEATAVAEVQGGTERVARIVARRIADHIAAERELLRTIGAAVTLGDDPALTLNAFSIQHPHLHGVTVLGPDGRAVARQGQPGPDHDEITRRALAGESAAAAVRPATADSGGPFAHTITVGEPIWIAGERAGAVVATVDLVDVWETVNVARMGRRGFVRLVASDGTLLAHGDPEERRYVFAAVDNLGFIERARRGGTVVNHQGVEVLAAVADVGERGWMIVVEQPVAEALGAVRAMRRDLLLLGGGALALAIGAAVLVGRKVVRGIERLEGHTRVLASGDLDARVEPSARIAELDSLARSINEMADSLKRHHREARERERLTTFGRVAAGLSHDLKQPLEHVRDACEGLAADRESPESWELFDWMRRDELPKLQRFLDDLRQLAVDGKAKLIMGEVAPERLLEELAANLRGSPRWAHKIQFEIASSAAPFLGDDTLLRRALYNLAANAAEACYRAPGGAGTVRLEAADRTDGVVFRVADTGPGMSPDLIERVMHGDFHSTKRTTGIGLGLGVARHVAQIHGGRIEVESEVGAGTTFTLFVPRDESQEPGGATR
ncbi:MAG TPA: sensor histidine kinase [Kofleriaceae bacterium]|nr:sensor histidine kinase [Kofleriaceae bacterium]